MPLTDDEIQMLAALTARCRPHGASRWDPPGIVAALRKVANRSLPAVIRACAAAAADPHNRTPGIIPQPGAHWREDAGLPFVAPTPLAELCRDCGKESGPGHPRDHEWVSLRGPRPARTHGGAAQVREALAAARAGQLGVASTPARKAGSPT